MALTKTERAEVEAIQTRLQAKVSEARPLAVGDYVKPIKRSDAQPYDHGIIVSLDGDRAGVIALGSAMELRWFSWQPVETLWLVDDADEASALAIEMFAVVWDKAASPKDAGDAANLIRSTLYGIAHR